MGSRYNTIVAMMDDPLNRACIDREIARRGKALQYLCPPVAKSSGGCTFPTFRYVCRYGVPKSGDVIDDQDAEVFTDGTSWFATLTYEGDAEIGPFGTKAISISEVQSFFIGAGFTILPSVPWEQEDALEWRIRSS